MKRKLLGERLLETGLVQEAQLAQALQAQQATGEQLGQLLMRLGYVTEGDLVRLLCTDAGVPFTPLDTEPPQADALALLPEAMARAIPALPVELLSDGRLRVALADPFDLSTVSTLERIARRRLAVIGAPRSAIVACVDSFYREAVGAAGAAAREEASGREAVADPAVVVESSGTATRIVEEVFHEAIRLGATDIHIEPTARSVRVRYRLDGILRDGSVYPKNVQPALLTRIKVIAGLNIAESRLPQDGRLRFGSAGREVDLRISTFPTIHGEDMVLRVLDRSRVSLQLERIGMEPGDLEIVREVLHRPLGLVLLTGPTGSGKTTTLYSALAEMNTGERCILTLEDPVEYELEGIRQSQINPRAGLTFASGLRSMLRHDPDVILVGEIRDQETAQISVSAAMTGHMVLSTLHTDAAASAIARMLDIGAEPFALASSLKLSIAQRLVRVLCSGCRGVAEVPAAVRRRFGLEDATLYQAHGCSACGGTGYRGRAAIFEVLPITEPIANLIAERCSAEELRRHVERPNLFQAGLEKVRAGDTSLEELLRVVSMT